MFDDMVANNYLLGTGNWQYALVIDDDMNPGANMQYEQSSAWSLSDGQGPFATSLVPGHIIAKAVVLTAGEWDVKRSGRGSIRECNEDSTSIPYNSSWTGTMPRSPISCAQRVPMRIELIPFGATDVRIAEFVTTSCDQSLLK
jgi:hypothetical protein